LELLQREMLDFATMLASSCQMGLKSWVFAVKKVWREPCFDVVKTREAFMQEKQTEDEQVDGAVPLDEAVQSEASDVKESPEYQELWGKYQRLLAEFENFRRRSARENLDLIDQANAKLLGKLTETYENMERAVEHAHDLGDGKSVCDLQGVLLTKDSLHKTLVEAGLEILDPVAQPFDPNFHEALMQQPHESIPADHVAQTFQKGYLVKGRVIRHAKVIVSTGA
jgi:molecular chaperone GrpE